MANSKPRRLSDQGPSRAASESGPGGKGRLIGSFSGAIQAMERRPESLIAGIVHNNLEGIKVHFQVRNVIGRIKFHHVLFGKIPKITL